MKDHQKTENFSLFEEEKNRIQLTTYQIQKISKDRFQEEVCLISQSLVSIFSTCFGPNGHFHFLDRSNLFPNDSSSTYFSPETTEEDIEKIFQFTKSSFKLSKEGNEIFSVSIYIFRFSIIVSLNLFLRV